MSPLDDPRGFLAGLFDVAVSAADPMTRVRDRLPEKPAGRVLVIGAGKASARMAEAVEAIWGPCEGLVITRCGYARECAGIEIVEAAHPTPDQAGVAATERMLALVQGLSTDDHVLALISGGGSSLLCAPVDGVSLADKIALNEALLASGAPISEMNIVRRHVSRVKGGQLAAACFPARLTTLLISDVPGDDPAQIASGPTVPDETTSDEALAILRRREISVPPSVHRALSKPSGVVAPDDPRLVRSSAHVIASPRLSLEAATTAAQGAGCRVRLLGDALEGEARDLGTAHAALALRCQGDLAKGDPPLLLLSGGECTVKRRGSGIGGPNAEYALAACLALGEAPGLHVLACDTDGVDGVAEIAGAYASPETLGRADARGLDASAELDRNNAHGFFAAVDGQVITGPTLTNVNDFRAFLVSHAG